MVWIEGGVVNDEIVVNEDDEEMNTREEGRAIDESAGDGGE